ncbi:hypothetical protein RJ640_019310 [Escallonia rubra]|uniref:Uncharacterized protein n=1 Tax=Escallonia rubra TaxID=112253 RepID=A0AA88UI37_9ASTE|nr:hypothetical protein RJ640_019310 [Escallonia rubra]
MEVTSYEFKQGKDDFWLKDLFDSYAQAPYRQIGSRLRDGVDFWHRQRDPAVEWRQIMDRQSGSGKAVSRWLTGEEKKRDPSLVTQLMASDKGDVFEGEERKTELPRGYEERIEGKGMVVRDWAPQLEILGHPSTGGFMSHCGWNSCMESITLGVPIAAWPMHSDQPRNAVLITRALKIGIAVKDWALRDDLVTSSTVKKAVRRLMASQEGTDIRKSAREMCGAVRTTVDEGGVTRMELESFIAHITR